MDTTFFENCGVDMDMDTAWNRFPPNSAWNHLVFWGSFRIQKYTVVIDKQ